MSIGTAALRILMHNFGANNEVNRRQWIEQTIPKIPKGSRILDAGAGTQQYRSLCSELVYVSHDFAKYDGSGDGVGLQTGHFEYGNLDIVSDITAIPEPDSSFDAILCTEVLEHIPSAQLAIKEFARLLRNNGHLILTAPFCSLTHFAPYHYSTGFNRYFYDHFLEKFGFKILEMERNGNFFEYIAQELLRLNNTAKKYSDSALNLVEKAMIFGLITTLKRFGEKDRGSNELLCFGYHIHAVKRLSVNS